VNLSTQEKEYKYSKFAFSNKYHGPFTVQKQIGWFMVFNATFNNISVISWRSVLLVEETGLPEENHQPIASH
jgi:hypothetical protein